MGSIGEVLSTSFGAVDMFINPRSAEANASKARRELTKQMDEAGLVIARIEAEDVRRQAEAAAKIIELSDYPVEVYPIIEVA